MLKRNQHLYLISAIDVYGHCRLLFGLNVSTIHAVLDIKHWHLLLKLIIELALSKHDITF